MPFQPGNTLSKGRPPKPKKQAKDWIEAHPYAYAQLLQVLYNKGMDGDRESAMYVCDRIKGKPKQQTDIELTGAGDIGAEMLVRLLEQIQLRRTLQLTGGDNAVQRQGITEGSSQEGSPEA